MHQKGDSYEHGSVLEDSYNFLNKVMLPYSMHLRRTQGRLDFIALLVSCLGNTMKTSDALSH